jgi:hypothetical protein
MIAGIDYSTLAVDVVLLDEDSDAATWHRFELKGQDAFERARGVRPKMPSPTDEFWDPILAVGIEQPRGNHGTVHLARIQGAVLACIPRRLLVHPLNPASWRKTVGLPGNASKSDIQEFAVNTLLAGGMPGTTPVWPQDGYDAYCIALATRTLLERVPA